MKSILLLAATAATLLPTITNAFVCDIPTAGCDKGMFNQATCTCDCIKPFCPDAQGQCTVAGGSCPDPWAKCTRGTDCPWWVNPNKAEACTTGPTPPPGMWLVYNTESVCCKANFPYSDACMKAPATASPTKHPTIARPMDDDFEAVPIKFEVKNLPDGINMRELQEEMLMVLKRIVLRLADRIADLKISSVEEKAVVTNDDRYKRNLLREEGVLLDTFDTTMTEPAATSSSSLRTNGQKQQQRRRDLQKTGNDATLYYNIYVVRDEDKKFGPIIISEMRDSYSEILEQIQTFSDIRFFTGEVELNWCAFQNGKYELCVHEVKKPPARAPTPIYVQSGEPDSEGGLGGGAIAGITISVLILLCCIGYAVAVFCFGVAGFFGENSYKDDTKINNNMYWDQDKGFEDEQSYRSSGRSRRGYNNDRNLAIMPQEYDDRTQATGRSRKSRKSQQQQIVLADEHAGDLQLVEDDGSFTINTRGTKTTRRIARDPTMYIPGQEDKPDPDTDILMLTDGDVGSRASSRKYIEDPPLKPKRDPTMYVKGGRGDYSAEDPPLKAKRDPTMFVEGQMDPDMFNDSSSRDPTMYVEGQEDPSMYMEGGGQDASMYDGGGSRRGGKNKKGSMYSEQSVEEMYNDDHHRGARGMHGIDEEEEEYDQYGFRSSQFSDNNGGHSASRKASYYEDGNMSQSGDTSFRTQEPSDESMKSKKSKNKKSRKSGKNKGNLRKSLQSNWGSSAPDVSGRMAGDDPQRDVKSFYN